MKTYLLFILLIPMCCFSQKMNIDDDIKARVLMMNKIVERKKTNEEKFKEGNYKALSFLTFSDEQKKVLDTLFSNSWKTRLDLFNKIQDADDNKNILKFVKHLVANETKFRNQLTKDQLITYNYEISVAEKETDSGIKLILRSLFFTTELYNEYLNKVK